MNGKIIGLVLIFLLSLSVASAITVSGPASAVLCQCSTITQKYSVCADVSGEYSLSIDSNQKSWFSAAPLKQSIASGECADFYVFVTPDCYSNANNYSAKMNFSGVESKTINFALSVSQCHTFNYDISPLDLGSNPCENTLRTISVTNTGNFTDEFVFLQNGLPDSWVSYPRERIILNAGQSFTGTVGVSPACSADANTYSFNIVLSNVRTNASSSKQLTQTVYDFVPFDLGGVSVEDLSQLSSCEEFDKNIVFSAVNLGTSEDEFTLSLFDVNGKKISDKIAFFDKEKFTLAPDANTVVSLIVKKNSAQIVNATISVHSKKYEKDYNSDFVISINDCYNVSLEKISSEESVCFGEKEIAFRAINTGSEKIDLNLEMNFAGLFVGDQNISLDANSRKEFLFTITPENPIKAVASVRAKSAFANAKIDFNFAFENCFDSSIDFNDVVLVCREGDVFETLKIVNKGTRAQSFALSTDVSWLYFSPSKIDVNSNSSAISRIVGVVPKSFGPTMTITAVSSAGELSKTVDVNELSNEECNAFELVAPILVDANCCSGTIIPINVKNTGYFDQELRIEALSPAWVSLSELDLSILPDSNKMLYAYIAPPAGTDGNYIVELAAFNDSNISVSVKFTARVRGGPCGLDNNINVKISTSPFPLDSNDLNIVTVNFVITNDSNTGFAVLEIYLPDLNQSFDFNNGKYLLPGDFMDANVPILIGANEKERELTVVVKTTAGTFTKRMPVGFTQPQNISITGFFSMFASPIFGVLLLVLLLALIVLALKPVNESKSQKK